MEQVIKIILIVTSGIIAVIFMGYFLVAGLFWVFNDSLNIIPNTPEYSDPAIKICEDRGGLPITSGWTGRLKICDLTDKNI